MTFEAKLILSIRFTLHKFCDKSRYCCVGPYCVLIGGLNVGPGFRHRLGTIRSFRGSRFGVCNGPSAVALRTGDNVSNRFDSLRKQDNNSQ